MYPWIYSAICQVVCIEEWTETRTPAQWEYQCSPASAKGPYPPSMGRSWSWHSKMPRQPAWAASTSWHCVPERHVSDAEEMQETTRAMHSLREQERRESSESPWGFTIRTGCPAKDEFYYELEHLNQKQPSNSRCQPGFPIISTHFIFVISPNTHFGKI